MISIKINETVHDKIIFHISYGMKMIESLDFNGSVNENGFL